MPKHFGELGKSLASPAGVEINVTSVDDEEGLISALAGQCDLLLSFGTSVIVGRDLLSCPGLTAVNIHAASPEFPGRDPHHFAHYFGAKTYGATLHFMIAKVDAGPIVDVELFDVPEGATPALLLEKANVAGVELMRRFFVAYARFGRPQANPSLKWGPRKSTRKDFLELCRVECDMAQEEFVRRLEATSMPGYKNLYVDLHGYRFRLEGKTK